MSLLKEISQMGNRGQVQTNLKNSDATDAGTYDVIDKASSSNDIKFMTMRNNINKSNTVTGVDVATYLNRAAELNDEVDTVPFGLETDDGDIVKVYVNASQADEFETAMKNLLGIEDDIEEAISRLSSEFDIIDVVWPDDGDDGIDDDFIDLDDPLDRGLPDNTSDELDGEPSETETVVDIDSTDGDVKKDSEDETTVIVPDKEGEEKEKEKEEVDDTVELSDEEKEKKKAKKKAEKPPTNEGNEMSMFLKKLLNEAVKKDEDTDSVKDGLHIPLDGQQKALMSKMKRQLEKKIVYFFVMAGIPGRYLNSSEIDDGIKEAADMLRKQVTIRRYFEKLYLGLGAAKGFAIKTAPVEPIEEAKTRRGGVIQKMLEAVMVKLGFPESMILTSGPATIGQFLLKTAKIIERDNDLEHSLRQLALRMNIKTGELVGVVEESIDVGSDEFANEVITLVTNLGIPETVLQQKRAIIIKSIREKKRTLQNRSEILRKMGILQAALDKADRTQAKSPNDSFM